ncbi:MAG: sigma-70 family RNA polymerase sigma factor [Ruminococcus sp.]|nr:sigma-70 family RNA polymerase sigma factor [Ruminococcus sp.]
MGDKSESAEQVIRRYADTVYRLAYARTGSKADADDVFQEVFLRYIRRKPELDDDEHLKAWFIRVTVNCCKSLALSYWNKHTEGLSDNLIFDSTGEYDLYYELQRLRPKEREVIHLYYYEDMSTGTIARTLGISEAAVRTRLARARRSLKAFMKEEDYV